MLDSTQEIEALEIDLLLEAVLQRSGLDFRGWLREPLRQRLRGFMRTRGLDTVSALQERVLHDPEARSHLLRALGKQPGRLFADAALYRELRDVLGPWLRSRPAPRIWVAECTGAEDVYSLAILLHEEHLADRTQIYATCSDENRLAEAALGTIDTVGLDEGERNYRTAGGNAALREYLCESESRNGRRTAFSAELGGNITWAQYNLATDASFNEFELILCRGMLPMFGPALRRRTLRLFHDSLARFGFLAADGIGNPEAEPSIAGYTPVRRELGIYRRIL